MSFHILIITCAVGIFNSFHSSNMKLIRCMPFISCTVYSDWVSCLKNFSIAKINCNMPYLAIRCFIFIENQISRLDIFFFNFFAGFVLVFLQSWQIYSCLTINILNKT